MKVNRLKPYIIFFGIVAFIVLGVDVIKEFNYNALIEKDIKDEYRAIVIEKYNRRKSMDIMTSVFIKRENGTEEGFPLRSEIINYISPGDSLIKIKNENICYVKKTDGEVKEFYFVRIPKENRNHWTFPKEWKNKWMVSSAWDTLQR